jgi:hypothetical protein
MKSILNASDKSGIIERIYNLKIDSQNLWGKMNVNEMLCHVTDQIKMATGHIDTKYRGNFVLNTIVKWLSLSLLPVPKGKIQTAKELNQEKDGTRPVGFDLDRDQLVKVIGDFDSTYPANSKIVHPVFGSMNMKQWGRLVYIHLDHHLRQFGV